MIEFKEVEKRYPNGYEALKHINLTIDQGEFAAIIGLSGAGKSTLIRTINRMHDITQGQLTVDGTDVMTLRGKSLRKFRRRIGMIFQSFNLVTRTKVINNVLMAKVPDLSFIRALLGIYPKDDKLAALEALFPRDSSLSHRDILGGLMGLGLTREKLGDILMEDGRCQVVVLREALPILLSQWEGAGRWKLKVREIPVSELSPRPPEVKTIRDTVAAMRLDAVLASGFSTSRSKAAELVSAGRVSVNHRECAKPDRVVEAGDVLTCRGLGKCVVREVLGQSKKGRTMLVLERYI